MCWKTGCIAATTAATDPGGGGGGSAAAVAASYQSSSSFPAPAGEVLAMAIRVIDGITRRVRRGSSGGDSFSSPSSPTFVAVAIVTAVVALLVGALLAFFVFLFWRRFLRHQLPSTSAKGAQPSVSNTVGFSPLKRRTYAFPQVLRSSGGGPSAAATAEPVVAVSNTQLVFGELMVGLTSCQSLGVVCLHHGGPIDVTITVPKSEFYTVQVAPPTLHFEEEEQQAEVVVSLTLNSTVFVRDSIAITCPQQTGGVLEVKIFGTGCPPLVIPWDEVTFGQIIGEGSTSFVRCGEWKSQMVAIKELRQQISSREFDILSKLRSPHILTFYGVSRSGNTTVFITEIAPYGNLATVLSIFSAMPLTLRYKIAVDVAKGMLYLHSCSIMHRDLKPENVLVVSVTDQSSVVAKISDFGLSRVAGTLTEQNYTTCIGSASYMAPEVFNNAYSFKADVFSYAILLWFLATSQEPYPGMATAYEVIQFVAGGNRLPNPPTIFHDLIELCWDHSPAARPDFSTVVVLLEQLLNPPKPLPPLPLSKTPRPAKTPPSSSLPPTPSPTPPVQT